MQITKTFREQKLHIFVMISLWP